MISNLLFGSSNLAGIVLTACALRHGCAAAAATATAIAGSVTIVVVVLFAAVAAPQNPRHGKEHDHVQELCQTERERNCLERAFLLFFGANVRRVVEVSVAKCLFQAIRVPVANVGVEGVGARLVLVGCQ